MKMSQIECFSKNGDCDRAIKLLQYIQDNLSKPDQYYLKGLIDLYNGHRYLNNC